MELLSQAYQYVLQNPERFSQALATHVALSAGVLGVVGLLAVPLGVLCAKRERVGEAVISGAGTLRVIPSLAVLALALPFLGTGFAPALVALGILAAPPILINTVLGFRQVPADMLEAAHGMGMGTLDILFRVEFPFALPAILTGLRVAAVEVIAGATLAAFIGGGGLGTFIINGLSMAAFHLLLVGAIPVAILALLAEGGALLAERAVVRVRA